MANDHKEKQKKRLKEIAFAAFLLSLGAAGWSLIALLGDFMSPGLLYISFFSFVPPIAVSLFMYVFCKYAENKAEAIVTEREEEEEQRRRDVVAAIFQGARPAGTEKPCALNPPTNSAALSD